MDGSIKACRLPIISEERHNFLTQLFITAAGLLQESPTLAPFTLQGRPMQLRYLFPTFRLHGPWFQLISRVSHALASFQSCITVSGETLGIQAITISFFARRSRPSVAGRIHPVSLWVPILLFAWQNVILVFVVLPSALWREFAAWLIR